MQLDSVTIPRVAVPLLIAIGYALYVIFDSPDGNALRWPSMVLWTLAGLCVLAYHLINRKKAPKQLLIASMASLAVAIGILVYTIEFVDGFGGLALFMVGVLPFVGLAALLFVASIYVPVRRSKPSQ